MKQKNYSQKIEAIKPSPQHLSKQFLSLVIREARIIHPKSILVVGSGNGDILDCLNKANIGQKRTVTIFPNNNLLPFKDNSFDLVICCNTLQLLNDPKKALSELHRVANQYVILSVPNEPWFRLANLFRGNDISRFGNLPGHINHWSGDTFEAVVGTKFTLFTKKQPFPWTVLVGEKI